MSDSIANIIDEIKNKISKMENQRIKIAIFGQPGAGKSSLVNSIIGSEQAAVSIKTDATTQVDKYDYDNLVLGDFPGYGTSAFPADGYLQRFGVLDYDIFLCVFAGKLHAADLRFFQQLHDNKRIILFVRTYSDSLWQAGKSSAQLQAEIIDNVQQVLGRTEKVFFVSNIDGIGVEELVEAIKDLIEPAKRDAFVRSVQAESEKMLEAKYRASQGLIKNYCRLAALNGINPIIGLDMALDMGILLKLFAEIRKVYGLTDYKLNKVTAVIPLAKRIMVYGTEWGLGMLLKNMGKKAIVGRAVKFVPIVGQAVSATAGYLIVQRAGESYLQGCKQLALELLRLKLDAVKAQDNRRV